MLETRNSSETSVFSRHVLPASFEYQVRGRMTLAQATVELHEYRFHGPQQARFQSPHAFLDLAISHRPGTAVGRYEASPEAMPRRLGDIIFIPADHGLQSECGGGGQSSICCQFEHCAVDARDGWTSQDPDASLDIRHPVIRETLLRLKGEIESPGFCAELMAETLCVQISIELGRYFRARKAGEKPTIRLCATQLHRIEELLEQPGKPPGILELAKECGFSTRHFFRAFRASTGTTLSAFATERRIIRARALLAERERPIKEIAWRCGFETAAAFSVAFRRAAGVSPREYREALRN